MNLAPADEIVDHYLEQSAHLVGILQDVQREYGYLPEEVLHHVAQRLDVSLARVHSVATFYGAFSLQPRGRHLISVCTGTACHLRGAPKLLDVLRGEFGLEDGANSADGRFTLKQVNCLGACALAPVVVVDGKYFNGMKPDTLLKALDDFP